jgi:hypothetical protein
VSSFPEPQVPLLALAPSSAGGVELPPPPLVQVAVLVPPATESMVMPGAA